MRNVIAPYFGEDENCSICGIMKMAGTTHYCGLGNRGAGGGEIPETYWHNEFKKYYPEQYAEGIYPGGHYGSSVKQETGQYPVDKLEDVLTKILARLEAIEKELK